jgi:hypothetical protein
VEYCSHARWINKFRYAVWYGVDTSEVNQGEDKTTVRLRLSPRPYRVQGVSLQETS